jgi:hypothetical protein
LINEPLSIEVLQLVAASMHREARRLRGADLRLEQAKLITFNGPATPLCFTTLGANKSAIDEVTMLPMSPVPDGFVPDCGPNLVFTQRSESSGTGGFCR